MDSALAFIVEYVFVLTGRAVVWLLSFGRWGGEEMTTNEALFYSAAGSLSFVRDGRRVITDTGLMFFGIAFYALLAMVLIASFA